MKTSNVLQVDKALSFNMAMLCQKLEGHYPPKPQSFPGMWGFVEAQLRKQEQL